MTQPPTGKVLLFRDVLIPENADAEAEYPLMTPLWKWQAAAYALRGQQGLTPEEWDAVCAEWIGITLSSS